MEREIAKTYPDAEYMDTWVWFQSGINTDGAHNPKTNRKLKKRRYFIFEYISNDFWILHCALKELYLLNSIDASLKAWEANIAVHKRGIELIKPGVRCSEICRELK